MEKLTSLTSYHHMLDNFGYEDIIFFFGVLAVKDAVLLVAESDTAEEI